MVRSCPLASHHKFLGGQPAHALDEAAFHLADIDGRVQRLADILQDIERSTVYSPVSVSMVTSLTEAP
jgi:hypothetical protein